MYSHSSAQEAHVSYTVVNKEEQDRRKFPLTSQSFHQCPGGITDHLRKFDPAALLMLPGKEHHEPVLEHHADQLRIQLAHHPPGVRGSPLINLSVRDLATDGLQIPVMTMTNAPL